MRLARLCELLIGLVLVAGAAMKAVNIPGFAAGIRSYHVFYNPTLLYNLAVFTIAVEAVLGAALLAGIRLRGLVHALVTALLVFFTAMIAYAWIAHGIEDCGCFGDYVKMGPRTSIFKNIVMIAMVGLPWIVTWRHASPTQWPFGHRAARIAAVVASLAIVAGSAAFSAKPTPARQTSAATPSEPSNTATPAPAGPFAGITVEDAGQSHNLSHGTFLVAILSATCDHCKASIEPLNALIAEATTPQVVGLVMGEVDELEQFRMETTPLFPTQLVDTMTWLEMLGDAKAPPRFILLENGVPVEHWDEDVPSADAVAAKVQLEEVEHS